MARHNYDLGAGESPWDNPDGSVADQTSIDINYVDGNVGIGLTNPQRPLHVEEALRLSRGANSTSFIFDRYGALGVNDTLASAGMFLETAAPANGNRDVFYISNYRGNVAGNPNPGKAFEIDLNTDQIRLPQYGAGTYDAVPVRFLGVEADGDVVEIQPTPVYVETFAGGSTDGAAAGVWTRNCAIARLGVGRWQVTFNAAHPDGINYHASFGAEEPAATRDNPKMIIEQGSKTANGFIVMLTIDDNGGGADPYNDQPWSFGVAAPVNVPTA